MATGKRKEGREEKERGGGVETERDQEQLCDLYRRNDVINDSSTRNYNNNNYNNNSCW